MISKEKNCIFIHIPKTGGTSIENMIWQADEKVEKNLCMGLVSRYHNKYQTGGLQQHLLASQVKQEGGDIFFNSAFKFSMVRNPFDRILSQYHYT